MSELSKLSYRPRRTAAFWLSNVSMLALMIAATSGSVAEAADSDADHPTVWIELGGQVERQTGQSSPFIPAFVTGNPDSKAFEDSFIPRSQHAARFSNGAEGSLTFEPNGSDWVFSASLRYGRSGGGTHASHHQATNDKFKLDLPARYYATCYCYGPSHRVSYVSNPSQVFSNVAAKRRQSHTLLDFQAGKDVGLGFLGQHSSSVLSLGVRIAQFSSRLNTTIHAIPKVSFHNVFGQSTEYYAPGASRHSYSETAQASRSFRGVGPSLSWNMSAPVVGHEESMSLNIDGGLNASVLFGRQRAEAHHQTSGYFLSSCNCDRLPIYVHTHDAARSRRVAIPNIGAFAGLSLKFPNAKVSLGYRGDFFLGAMDTGIDTRKPSTVGFYGPYATISIGLGG